MALLLRHRVDGLSQAKLRDESGWLSLIHISELCLAETIYAMAQEKGHMALTVGQGEAVREISGRGIADVRKRADEAYKRSRGPRAV